MAVTSSTQDTIAGLMSHFWGIWRHRWLALGVAWVVAIAGWAYVWQMPSYYQATARIFVDTNTVLRPLLKGLAITPDTTSRVRMMSSTLLSRPNLERLARMTDLDLAATTEQEKERLVNRLRDSVSLRGQRGNESLYNLVVTEREREVARRVAQSLITVFIESSLSGKRSDSVGAQAFLDEQIKDYEQRLIEAENRLARFKQENVNLLPGSKGGDYYSRLETVRAELQAAKLAQEEMQQRRDELERQLNSDNPSVDSLMNSGLVTPLDARIEQLRAELDGLLTRYTELHPQVRQIEGLIEELERRREEELARLLGGGAAGVRSDDGDVYGSMRAMLAEAEAGVAELKVRVQEYSRREEELLAALQRIPETEARLKQLDRDYSVIKKQYETLVSRRESAKISQDVEVKSDDVIFRVVDPPFVPSRPTTPNKLLYNLAVLLVAFGAGGGVALLVSMIRPVVTDARSLSEATGLPLLGVVTNSLDARQALGDRLRLAGFAAANACLFLAFAGVLFGSGVL